MNYKHQQKSQKTSIEEYLSSKYADLQPPTSLKIPLSQYIYHAASENLTDTFFTESLLPKPLTEV